MLIAVAAEVQAALATGMLALLAVVASGVLSLLGKRASDRAGVKADRVADRLGDPNGQGDIVAMLTEHGQLLGLLQQGQVAVVAGQAGQDNRLARIETRQHDHETRLSVVEARTAGCPRQDPPPPPAA